MKFRRIVSLVLSAVMLMLYLPSAIYAEGNITLSLSSSVPTEEKVKLGDTVTYTVNIKNNSGFSFGTLYFVPSDNLTCVGATLEGEETTALKAVTGENAGAYGIIVAGETVTKTGDYCTITFKVTDKGDISLGFYTYQLTDGEEFITPVIENSHIVHEAEEITAPTVITNELPEATLGYEYSFKLDGGNSDFLTWSIEGELPEGLTFAPDGTLSGIPSQAGEFPLVFKAALLDEYVSEGKSLTLTVIEKPKELELKDDSGFHIDGEWLRKVVERTTLEGLISNFENCESIKVFNANGVEVTSPTALIGTGYTVSLMHGDEKVHTVTVVVLGDVSGNGRIDTMDYQRVKMCLFGTFDLEGAYYQAALVAGRANITTMDYQRIKMHIFGTFNIYK